MNTNALATADALSDHDLLTRVTSLANCEREAAAELVAPLAVLDTRPSIFLARGYGSLHAYCTQALHLSEDAASNRIAAARACRRFPVILDRLASGELSLTAVRMLHRHLTTENHLGVLDEAKRATLKQVDRMVAALAPQPDVPSLVRRLPTHVSQPAPAPDLPVVVTAPPAMAPQVSPPALAPPPVVRPTSPERYRVQFTIGEETHAKLERLQTLLRREIPSGDPAAIFDRAITLLLARVENKKLGMTPNPGPPRPAIRRETDDLGIRTPPRPPRRPRSAVRREVSRRDAAQCGFVSSDGHRCTERVFLEFHHVITYARGGEATPENMSLRCRRHNQYEAELIFGPRKT